MIDCSYLELRQDSANACYGLLTGLIEKIDSLLGKGYAIKNPELIARLVSAEMHHLAITELIVCLQENTSSLTETFRSTLEGIAEDEDIRRALREKDAKK